MYTHTKQNLVKKQKRLKKKTKYQIKCAKNATK